MPKAKKAIFHYLLGNIHKQQNTDMVNIMNPKYYITLDNTEVNLFSTAHCFLKNDNLDTNWQRMY